MPEVFWFKSFIVICQTPIACQIFEKAFGNMESHKVKNKRSERCYEVEYFEKGVTYETKKKHCLKKELHSNYISVSDVTIDHLPEQARDERLLELIWIRCQLTGLIDIQEEKDCHCFGTCFVQKLEQKSEPCPCPDCKGHGKTEFGCVTLSTAYHVIDSNEIAKCSTVKLFYDKPDSSATEKLLHGLNSHDDNESEDWSAFVCVTHDDDLIKELTDLLDRHWQRGLELKTIYEHSGIDFVVIISHPHGGPKCVSLGDLKKTVKGKDVREGQEWCSYWYTATTCEGSSGAAVYVLGKWIEGFGYWFGHPHNHSKYDGKVGHSSLGVRIS